MIVGKNREAAAIFTNMIILRFHQISLSLNYNKSVSISIENDHLDEYHNIRSLQKGEKHLLFGNSFF